MRKILFLSVGGSSEPLITSIKTVRPELVVFVCSRDTNNVEGSYTQVPKILEKTRDVSYDSEEILVAPDDPEECIGKIMTKVEKLRKDYGDAEIVVDYTGGTKTMSVSLFWVAVQKNLGIYLTTGIRRNLQAVIEGESTRKCSLSFPYYDQVLGSVDYLLKNFHYTSAEEMLCSALVSYHLSSDMQDDLQRTREVISVFRLWDAYDSINAFRRASPYRKALWESYLCFWDKVIADRMKMEEDFKKEVKELKLSISYENAPTQYAIVQDLLLNAERCAVRGRYDDATARLYRALESLAQLRLLSKHGINSGDVDINRVPSQCRWKYEAKRREGKIRLGLVEDYELLSKLKDEIGKAFEERRGDMMEAIWRRNQSVLAHGFKSISESEYGCIKEKIEGFIKDCLRKLLGSGYSEPKQLPRSMEEIDNLLKKG